MLVSKDIDNAIEQKLELLNPNGPIHGRLTHDEAFDKIGKFCGQPTAFGKLSKR